MLDFVCGQPAVDLIGDDGVGVHDVLGDGFDLFHVAGEAAGVDDMSMPKFMWGSVGHAHFFTKHFDVSARMMSRCVSRRVSFTSLFSLI